MADILHDAVALIESGKKAEARKLLEPFIKANPHDVPAWLLETETWPAAADKRKILEACLRYNPGAPRVQQALAALGPTTTAPASASTDSGRQPTAATEPGSLVPPHRKSRLVGSQHIIILGGALLVAALGLLVYGYLSSTRCSRVPGSCPRILFIGNSYTYVNDLPGTFARLASAGGHEVETGMMAEGGWTLADHASSAGTLDKLESSKWNFVVLQEQSQIPSVELSRTENMYPAARTLVRRIEADGATPIFFLTWAHRQGWPENGLNSYEDMQFQIDHGYLTIARELNVPVAPVGYAWLLARRQNPQLDLWQEDGSHPNEQGTYLAACVFYATIFRESPEGLLYMAHVPKEVAQVLQTIAADAVLKDPSSGIFLEPG